ncbi:hypothetical protein SEA_HAMMY_3 [Mycobacterium phage Hammy]|uniref:Uncharacterized protein n=2 Tax=Amginevirus TaxID=2946794 RepID=A0A222ZPD6_9CAUD|nr:hypothetical protein I5G85_gp03 [Mycobacterium phage Amohnition]YP_009951962.1 hypothetical protein I5G86_gp03 [Mycobacterium phage DarthP]APD18176.1 hypothetical protein SEA_HAMMY_3 [Mycobacterium phage Hammy]ASR86285.1 hypothetical protein SEA_AMOHNITION_3 [Mycobacterium phage Amohnition]ASW31750.1 hypothetical protein SEA_DARTHP_3 [Mycobacterium phage DarthP]
MRPRPVGVVAGTKPVAEAIIRDLGLTNAVPISRRTGARGFTLSALIFDDSALPLSEKAWHELAPSLLPDRCDHVYELRRLSDSPR